MMQCPSCNSEKTQSVPCLYEKGICNVSTSCKAEFNIDFSGLFAEIFSFSNENKSGHITTHQKISPPARFPILKPIGVIFLLFMILIVSKVLNNYSLSLWAALALSWAFIATIYNKIMLPAYVQVWSNSFYCHDCKYLFDETSHVKDREDHE